MDALLFGVFSAIFVLLGVSLTLRWTKLSVQDVCLFWAILLGSNSSRTRAMKKPLKLHTYLARTTDLDLVSLEELYRFAKRFIQAPSTSLDSDEILKNFVRTVQSYSHVMLCRERSDGSLRGMMLIGIERNGGYTLIKWGLVMFMSFYRGGPWMYWVLIYVSLKELLLHPFTPLYHGGKIYSYKSYLMITPFDELYPRYDKKTPPLMKVMIDQIALSAKQPTENYNQETCVLEREYSYLKEHVAPITDEEMKNPHIKFFTEQNPGWKKGHCLIVVTHMTWREVFKAAFIGFRKSSIHAGILKPQKKPLLKRGLTYQAPGFSSCAAIINNNGIENINQEEYAVIRDNDEEVTADQSEEPGIF